MKELFYRFIFNEKIEYLFWGAMTTLVYFIARLVSMAVMANAMIPVAIAEVISIIFAFIVNKYLVFNGPQSKSVKAQLIIFIIGRAFAAALDFLFTELMIVKFYRFFIHIFLLNRLNYQSFPLNGVLYNFLGSPILMNKVISVIFIQILIIIINFIVSKYFAFK